MTLPQLATEVSGEDEHTVHLEADSLYVLEAAPRAGLKVIAECREP